MKELLESCNKAFGINVPEKKFKWVYDVYNSKAEFEENVDDDFDELNKSGTAKIVNDKYVFFNDVNYNWELDKPQEMPD